MFIPKTLSGTIDPFKFTPAHNFMAGGGSRKAPSIDYRYDDTDIIWQEDVYRLAASLAKSNDFCQIIDLSTGSGQKLYTEFNDYPGELWQTDIEDIRIKSPLKARFVRVDLQCSQDLELLENIASGDDKILIILSDVIEHICDPRLLLRTLRKLLRRNSSSRLIISTPDRELIDGNNESSPPDDFKHVRQWTLNEFGIALLSAGFRVEKIGRVKQNTYDEYYKTIYAELSCDPIHYQQWLMEADLPSSSNTLLITTEHSGASRTGGIGTYIKLVCDLISPRPLVLFVGSHGLTLEDRSQFAHNNGIILLERFFCVSGNLDQSSLIEHIGIIDHELILHAVVHLCFMYDQLRLIEYQDYLGIGYRVAQASRSFLLPYDVKTIAILHGNHFYLENASGQFSGLQSSVFTHAIERISIENSDICLYPSNFIKELYEQDAGIFLPHPIHSPYPIHVESIRVDQRSVGRIDTIIFYGKKTKQKGYYDFIEAILILFGDQFSSSAAREIKTIVLMGVEEPEPRLAGLPVNVIYGVYSRGEAYTELLRYSSSALVVLPYKADNQPLSVYDAVLTLTQPIFYESGGIPEITPAALSAKLLSKPRPTDLAGAIFSALRQSQYQRYQALQNIIYHYSLMTASFVTDFLSLHQNLLDQETACKVSHPSRKSLSVIIPNYNGPMRFLEDVFYGISNSTLRPSEIVIVDDGSSLPSKLALKEFVNNLPMNNIQIVESENNGLSSARNLGLEYIKGEYVCVHDNDNVVLGDFFKRACMMLDADPSVAAVTAWSLRLENYANPRTSVVDDKPFYRPIGPDLGLGLLSNIIGDALAVYRTAALNEIGGWNQGSKAKWEDWELFGKLIARGHRVLLIPAEQFMYRVRHDSMLQTYSQFPGWLRLSNILDGIPKSQAQSIVRSLWALSSELEYQRDQYALLQQSSAVQAEKLHWNRVKMMQMRVEARSRRKSLANLFNRLAINIGRLGVNAKK